MCKWTRLPRLAAENDWQQADHAADERRARRESIWLARIAALENPDRYSVSEPGATRAGRVCAEMCYAINQDGSVDGCQIRPGELRRLLTRAYKAAV